MSLETTTESLCDQLKKFVAKQMEKERLEEERLKENRETNGKILAFLGLSLLVIVVLTVLGCLLAYLWVCWRSRRAGPVTRIPKTPISNKNLLECSRNKISRAKIYISSQREYANYCTEKLRKIMKLVFNLKSPTFLSHKIRVVSIRMDGFSNGPEFHRFEPADGVILGSHFTYQMFGDDTIQVTRYVVGNKCYVAGFCIYVKNDSVAGVDINMNVIKKLLKEAKYPGKEAVEKEMKVGSEKTEAVKENVPSKFTFKFWTSRSLKSATKTEQNDVPPSYSSLSIA